jgi:hypothetical protein
MYETVRNLKRTKKLPPYHKVRVRIGTLEVMPPNLVRVIPLPHVNCTWTVTRALRPLIPRWKEARPPIRFIIAPPPRDPDLLDDAIPTNA